MHHHLYDVAAVGSLQFCCRRAIQWRIAEVEQRDLRVDRGDNVVGTKKLSIVNSHAADTTAGGVDRGDGLSSADGAAVGLQPGHEGVGQGL